MLMIGFLGGTWWAAKRAARVKCDPDLVVNLGFAALLSSVIGARVFYVLHYWDTHFAGRSIWAAVDITAGGMEFYGGFIGAFAAVMIYLAIKRVSIRLYLDILAPSLMFGMGMARIGCFLNGCCWGTACDPQIPWAVTFPYASPASLRQWEERVITYPAELITVYTSGTASLLPRDELAGTAGRQSLEVRLQKAQAALDQAQIKGADDKTLAQLRARRDAARLAADKQARGNRFFTQEKYLVSDAELEDRARDARTHTVQPVQLYASMDGILLAILLNNLFYRRKRDGVVTVVLFMLYPIMRIIEEIIRSDNPHDVVGLTISQFISVAIFTAATIYLIAIYRMPARATGGPVARPGGPARPAPAKRK
jgi:phosphatidylglycerol:prolipoprotein diacylglycerol transferase